MRWRTRPFRLWFFVITVLVVLSSAFLFSLGRITHESILKQLYYSESIVSKAQASNIMAFFHDYGDSIAVLGQLKSMERMDETSLQDMELFMQQWLDSGLVSGVALTDKNGIVVYNSNDEGKGETGINLSDRDYFKWAAAQTEEGKYIVGKPVVSRFGASKGKVIVPLATPVFKDGEFVGIMASSVRLRALTSRFLGFLKISDSMTIYLVESDGSLIFNNKKVGDYGLNLFDAYLSSLRGKIVLDKSGYITTKTDIVSYLPVNLEGQNWALITVTPFDFNGFNKLIYIKLALLLFLVISNLLVFGLFGSQKLNSPPLRQR